MTDYKLEAAKAALQFIKPEQIIGLGAGSTIAHLINLLAADPKLAASLTFATSSFKTASLLMDRNMHIKGMEHITRLDIYFDGCDQFDAQLNALKCGGGIHTSEKILATLANEFILIGDASKSVEKLDNAYPLVLEVLPAALHLVKQQIVKKFPDVQINMRISTQKDGAVITENGNYLLDVYLDGVMPLDKLNAFKMITGVVEHSLFPGIAKRAIIAGEEGVKVLSPA